MRSIHDDSTWFEIDVVPYKVTWCDLYRNQNRSNIIKEFECGLVQKYGIVKSPIADIKKNRKLAIENYLEQKEIGTISTSRKPLLTENNLNTSTER